MAKHGMEWTPEQIALLKEYYPNNLTADLVSLVGRTENSIYGKAHKLGLKKSAEFFASSRCGLFIPSPIGTEWTDKCGYLIRKVNNDLPLNKRWKAAHVIVWEKHHGPVPEGCMVTFKDGNKKNFYPENLELVTRKDLLDRNTVHRYPKDVVSTIFVLGKFKRAIERRTKNA